MSSHCVSKKTYSHCCHYLTDNIFRYRDLTIRLYSYYFTDDYKYKVSETSNYCRSYIQSDISYNLTISSAELTHLRKKLL